MGVVMAGEKDLADIDCDGQVPPAGWVPAVVDGAPAAGDVFDLDDEADA